MSFFSKKNLVFLLMPLCFIQPSFAICGVIPVKSIKASSSFSDKDVSYDASYASDSRLSTIWMEGEEGSGLGDWIEFSFEKDVTVSKLVFYNGNWDSRDFYQRYNRVKSFQVKFSNGSIQKIDLADKMEKQVVALEKPVTTKSLRLVLKEVYKGTTFQDTPISEVMFFSPDPTSVVDNLKVKASSFMPADSGATYVADNVFDSMVDTMWCEGKSDSGVGESLTIALNKNQSIKELRLLNGVVVSNDVYKKIIEYHLC